MKCKKNVALYSNITYFLDLVHEDLAPLYRAFLSESKLYNAYCYCYMENTEFYQRMNMKTYLINKYITQCLKLAQYFLKAKAEKLYLVRESSSYNLRSCSLVHPLR